MCYYFATTRSFCIGYIHTYFLFFFAKHFHFLQRKEEKSKQVRLSSLFSHFCYILFLISTINLHHFQFPEGADWPQPKTSPGVKFNFMMKLLNKSVVSKLTRHFLGRFLRSYNIMYLWEKII
jgi:hypothetical protein